MSNATTAPRTILVPCPGCDGEAELKVDFQVEPGEPRTWSAPGSAPYVNVLGTHDRECQCFPSYAELALAVEDAWDA